jgi:hypothetical protein
MLRAPIRNRVANASTLPIFVVLLAPAVLTAEQREPCISAMNARLFLAKTGTLTEADVSAPAHRGFWNNPAEADASNAILVAVEIVGPPFANYSGADGPKTKRSVTLVASDEKHGKNLLTATQPIRPLADTGKVYVAFLVYHDGCMPIKLQARIQGKPNAKPFEKQINFACGE